MSAITFPTPLPDDTRAYITGWICWQVSVHQCQPADIAEALNRAQVPCWLHECWTAAAVEAARRSVI